MAILDTVKGFWDSVIKRQPPLVNDPVAIITQPFGRTTEVSYASLWQYFKSSPEIQLCFQIINNDVISDGYHLEGGRNAKLKAEKFLEENRANEQFSAWLFDRLVTGDGYLYKRRFSGDDVKSFFPKIAKQFSVFPREYKSYVSDLMRIKYLYELKAEDEDILRTRAFQYIPSSTIKIRYDMHGNVTNYIQQVGAKLAKFEPDEIIHWRYLTINGKVYGYTPLRSLDTILDTLENIKDLAKDNTETGEVNAIYNFPDETPDSNTFKAAKKRIQEYGQLQHRKKTLVISGNFNRIATGKTEDMDYSKLSRYLTQITVNLFQIPESRIPGLLSERGIRAARTEEGYWRFISHIQNEMESLINLHLLDKWNVKYRFNRTYKQDEVRETLILMNKADYWSKLQGEAARFNKRLKQESWLRFFNIKENELEQEKEKKEILQPILPMGQKPKVKEAMADSEAKLQQDKMRQETQTERAMGMKNKNILSEVHKLETKGFTKDEIEDFIRNESL